MPGWYKSADIIRQNLRGGKLPRSLLAAEDLLKSLDEINTHVPVEDLIECVKAHVEEKLMCGAEGTPPLTRLNMNNSVFDSPPPGLLDPGFDPLFVPAAQRRTLDPASLQRRPKTVRLIGFKYQFLRTACDPTGNCVITLKLPMTLNVPSHISWHMATHLYEYPFCRLVMAT